FFFFQAEDGIRYRNVTGVQTCALPILLRLIQSMMQASDFLFRMFTCCVYIRKVWSFQSISSSNRDTSRCGNALKINVHEILLSYKTKQRFSLILCSK